MQKAKVKGRFKWFRRNADRKVHRQIKDRLFRFFKEISSGGLEYAVRRV